MITIISHFEKKLHLAYQLVKTVARAPAQCMMFYCHLLPILSDVLCNSNILMMTPPATTTPTPPVMNFLLGTVKEACYSKIVKTNTYHQF